MGCDVVREVAVSCTLDCLNCTPLHREWSLLGVYSLRMRSEEEPLAKRVKYVQYPGLHKREKVSYFSPPIERKMHGSQRSWVRCLTRPRIRLHGQ